MRSIGLDVHQSFCQVAIHADGETRSAGRIATDRTELELFARSLDLTDQAETVSGCLRQIDFCDAEVEAIDAKLCKWATGSEEAGRLMTIPGIGVGAPSP